MSTEKSKNQARPSDVNTFLTAGVAHTTKQVIRALVQKKGYQPPEKPMEGGGGGAFYVRVGRWLYGGDGAGGGVDMRGKGYVADGGGGGGTMNVGLLVVDEPFFRLYPMLSIGGRGEGLSFEESGADESAEISVGRGGVLFRVGFGVELRLKVFWRIGVVVAVRAGLQYAPLMTGWEGDNVDQLPETEAPDSGWQPYTQFLFGTFLTNRES